MAETWRGTFAQPVCEQCWKKQGQKVPQQQPPAPKLLTLLDSTSVKPLESAEIPQKALIPNQKKDMAGESVLRTGLLGLMFNVWVVFTVGLVAGLVSGIIICKVFPF
jgi:hypothetical protein